MKTSVDAAKPQPSRLVWLDLSLPVLGLSLALCNVLYFAYWATNADATAQRQTLAPIMSHR